MREYGSQAVVWQTAINPVVALELLATGTWSGTGVLGPGGVRRRAVPRPADRLRLAVGDARGRLSQRAAPSRGRRARIRRSRTPGRRCSRRGSTRRAVGPPATRRPARRPADDRPRRRPTRAGGARRPRRPPPRPRARGHRRPRTARPRPRRRGASATARRRRAGRGSRCSSARAPSTAAARHVSVNQPPSGWARSRRAAITAAASGTAGGYRSRSPFRARSSYRTGMCRSIKTLRRAETAATTGELEAAARQFVRKISGYREPSARNRGRVRSRHRGDRVVVPASARSPGRRRRGRSESLDAIGRTSLTIAPWWSRPGLEARDGRLTLRPGRGDLPRSLAASRRRGPSASRLRSRSG